MCQCDDEIYNQQSQVSFLLSQQHFQSRYRIHGRGMIFAQNDKRKGMTRSKNQGQESNPDDRHYCRQSNLDRYMRGVKHVATIM